MVPTLVDQAVILVEPERFAEAAVTVTSLVPAALSMVTTTILAAATTPRPAVPLSAPSLTPTRLAAYLDEVSVPTLMQVVEPAGEWLGSDNPTAQPLFPRGSLEQLVLLVTTSQPAWQFDID